MVLPTLCKQYHPGTELNWLVKAVSVNWMKLDDVKTRPPIIFSMSGMWHISLRNYNLPKYRLLFDEERSIISSSLLIQIMSGTHGHFS